MGRSYFMWNALQGREKQLSWLKLYGRGLIAEEYCRYLEGQGRGADVAAFAVTSMNGQGDSYCGRPCLEIREAITRKKMSPTSIGGGGEYHNRRERISPASLKGQEEALSIDKAGTMAL